MQRKADAFNYNATTRATFPAARSSPRCPPPDLARSCSKVEGMSRARFPLIAALLLTLASACGGDDPSPSATASPPGATVTRTPAASPSPSQTASTGTPGASIHPGPAGQPLGFPIAPTTRLGLVSGSLGSRSLDWGGGPEAPAYSRDAQPPG